jgi:hypothetical protein
VTTWHKSSYSQPNNDCIEVIGTLDRVRDSKNPDGPVLALDLKHFLAQLKADRLTNP